MYVLAPTQNQVFTSKGIKLCMPCMQIVCHGPAVFTVCVAEKPMDLARAACNLYKLQGCGLRRFSWWEKMMMMMMMMLMMVMMMMMMMMIMMMRMMRTRTRTRTRMRMRMTMKMRMRRRGRIKELASRPCLRHACITCEHPFGLPHLHSAHPGLHFSRYSCVPV